MLSAVRPAAPLRAKYEARVVAVLLAMHRDLVKTVEREWRRDAPETVLLAQDKIPAKVLRDAIARKGRDWLRRFDTLSDELAQYFATSIRSRCDRALMDMLKRGGMTVKFTMTPAMRDAYAAVVSENVGLIRSIAERHLGNVETLVMQSVSQGHDLGTLAKALEKTYGVSKRRAAFIARDQNSKATAVLQKVRHLELGITRAKWLHSAGGKHPREPHVRFSGKTYGIREGHDFGDGNGPVWPGTAINCRCVAVPIVPGFE